jgi:hypothetical protein
LNNVLHDFIVGGMAKKKRTGPGRPAKTKADKWGKRVMVNMMPHEFARIKAEARRSGLTLSTVIMRPWREES